MRAMLQILLLLRLFQPPQPCPTDTVWLSGDEREDAVHRRETRFRMRRTWRALGVDREGVEVLDSIVMRESYGDRCAVHILGRNEYGLGPGGLQVKFHLHRWDKKADPKVLHIPEVSAVVMLRLLRKFKRVYRAETWLDIGRLYGGRMKYPDIGMDELWCQRLARRGISCHDPVSELGRRLSDKPTEDQDMFLRVQRAKNTLSWSARRAGR